MSLNIWGTVVLEQWKQTGNLRDNVKLDAFVIMPNHVHGIIWIINNDDNDGNRRGMMHHAPTTTHRHDPLDSTLRKFSHPIANSLSTIVAHLRQR